MNVSGALPALLVWFCVCFASISGAYAAPAALTFPPLTGRVVDDAGLLSPQDRASLTASLAGLEARTSDQLVIVTLKSLQGTAIEDYGYQLGRAWGIGQKDRNSGALLIVSAGDKQVRIEVGYGLEGTLTDAASKIIIENAILPPFKTGDFAAGIKAGTGQIIQLLEGDDAASSPGEAVNAISGPPVHGVPVPGWVILLGALTAVSVLIFCAVHGGFVCSAIFQMLFMMAMSGRGKSSGDRPSSFSGGGGSFGGGGSSGSW